MLGAFLNKKQDLEVFENRRSSFKLRVKARDHRIQARTNMIFMAATMCALCSCVASSALPQDTQEPLASSNPFASVEAAHLKNPQLAHETLFGQLGLDTADVGVLVEAERAELMTALRDSGLQLGDRVKIRLWMDRKMPSKEAGPSAEPAAERRAQVETTASVSPSISDDASEHGCGGAPDFPSPAASACRVGRRVQEKEASTAKGGGLSAETVAIMVTVLLGLASYGAACPPAQLLSLMCAQ